ncbi:hypothetical protein RFI_40099, partial [Reticulomyxa filosa]
MEQNGIPVSSAVTTNVLEINEKKQAESTLLTDESNKVIEKQNDQPTTSEQSTVQQVCSDIEQLYTCIQLNKDDLARKDINTDSNTLTQMQFQSQAQPQVKISMTGTSELESTDKLKLSISHSCQNFLSFKN